MESRETQQQQQQQQHSSNVGGVDRMQAMPPFEMMTYSSFDFSTLKKRGRPRNYASANNNIDSGGPSGLPPPEPPPQGDPFIPHFITFDSGEDIGSKIYELFRAGPRNICILSASGAIGNVTLRQPSNPPTTLTYEGRFEIISLTGSCLHHDEHGKRLRSGAGRLSVALADSDGQVFGGAVAGQLKALGPVQVLMYSFESPKSVPCSPLTTSTPVSSHGASSSENTTSPINQGPGIQGNASQPMPMYMYPRHPWDGQNPWDFRTQQ